MKTRSRNLAGATFALAAWLGICGAVFAETGTVEIAGDPENGRKLAGQCRVCHGLDGVARIPIAPHIGGESTGYLTRQLVAFRDGARAHEMMNLVVKGLSDKAIADVAAWYSAQIPIVEMSADPTEAPPGCASCHGADGLSVIDEAPHLAGESEIYIATQLKAFRIAARGHEVMVEVTKNMSDEEIREVAKWYASINFSTRPSE